MLEAVGDALRDRNGSSINVPSIRELFSLKTPDLSTFDLVAAAAGWGGDLHPPPPGFSFPFRFFSSVFSLSF